MLADALTKDPARVTQTFTQTEQAHIYITEMVKEAVAYVMSVREEVVRNPDNLMGEPTFESDSFDVCARFLGRSFKRPMGNNKFAKVRDYSA